MKITRTKKNLQEKKLYEGYIVKVEEDEEYGIARLYIELDDYPDEWFYTSLQMEESGKMCIRDRNCGRNYLLSGISAGSSVPILCRTDVG